jgi:2'-5' RNA ligase
MSGAMQSIRAFLAIPLPDPLRDSIAALQRDLRSQIPPASWTRPENLHLTLHFFGDISQEYLEKLKVSVLSVRDCQRPFSVTVNGLGAFPSRHRPRIIWLGLEPEDPLRQLYGNCMKFLLQAGLVTGPGSYTPHLTIGRLRRQKPDLTDLCNSVACSPLGQLPVDRLILYESRLHPGGAEHIPRLTVNLDDEGSPEQNS